MKFFLKYAHFVVFFLLVAMGLAEGYRLYQKYRYLKSETLQNNTMQQEIERLENSSTKPTLEHAYRLERTLQDNDINMVLFSQPSKTIKITYLEGNKPKNEIDFYFAMMSYVHLLTERAQQRQIEIPKDFYFGFDPYVQKNIIPQKESIYPLYKQSKIAAKLLSVLFDSNDRGLKLTLFRRESIMNFLQKTGEIEVVQSKKSKKKSVKIDAVGVFDPGKEVILRSKDQLSYLFSFQFECYTSTLRNFLNALQEYRFPVIIRQLEITNKETKSGGTIKTEKSQVKVTLEWLLLNFGSNKLKAERIEKE